MKKVLVVGGAGYIGSHVAKEFLDKGYEVRVYDDLSTGQEINLFPKAEFINKDILDYTSLSKALEGVDGVVHLAAKKNVGESMEQPNMYTQNNIVGSLNLLCAMVEKKINNLVFSSSCSIYGQPQYLPVDENHPYNPMSLYGFTKYDIEKYMQWYDTLKGLRFMSLRYFNAVGYDKDGAVKGREVNPQNLLPIIIEVAEGAREKLKVFGTDYDTRDGTCIRDYIHVSDLATGHVLAMEKLWDGAKSEFINLGTGIGTTVKEVITAAEKVMNKKVHVEYAGRRAGDPAQVFATYEKAKKVLGWEPKYTNIEDIIKTCL